MGKAEQVFLYAAEVTPLTDPDMLAAAHAAVSPARREKADALRRPADRQRSLAAGLLLQHTLSLLGADAAAVITDAYGKPYLPGGPAFSLSHSGDYVLCAAADRPVGCDVQHIGEFRPRVAKRCLSAAEYEDVLARPERFYRYWTLKESFVKALGTGMRLPLREIEFRLEPTVSLSQDFDARDFGFAEFELPGHRCALCAVDGCGDVKLKLIPLPL